MQISELLIKKNADRAGDLSGAGSYLVRTNNAAVAHLWNGTDTECRMASSGGLNLRKFKLASEANVPTCTNCVAVSISRQSKAEA